MVVGSDPRTENSYNGLNWRVSKRADTDLDGSLDEQRVMYYNAGWQLVEEDIYEGWTSGNPGSVDEVRAYLWGARYIDDAIAMLIDGDADGDYDPTSFDDEFFFFVTDAQFSVVAVLDISGDLEERITYDAYGTARHHDWRDVDGDGDYDSTDYNTITTISQSIENLIGQADYEVDADVDRDGDVDSTDQTLAGTNYPTALTKGELSYPAIGNIIGYDGYIFNAETEQYTVRWRHYDTVLGRWLERDPSGYNDGFNLFELMSSTPLVYGDPLGLWKWKGGKPQGKEWAVIIAEQGDSTDSAARFVGLAANETDKWLYGLVPGPRLSPFPVGIPPNSEIRPGCSYFVPNTFYIGKGDVGFVKPWSPLSWTLTHFADWRIGQLRTTLERSGRKVIVDKDSTLSELRGAMSSPSLWGWAYASHGESTTQKGSLMTSDGRIVDPKPLHRVLHHRHAFVSLLVCYAGKRRVADGPNDVGWADFVSPNGIIRVESGAIRIDWFGCGFYDLTPWHGTQN